MMNVAVGFSYRPKAILSILTARSPEAYDLPQLLRQHVTGEIIPRVTPSAGSRAGGA
jgi:hypothetical protein